MKLVKLNKLYQIILFKIVLIKGKLKKIINKKGKLLLYIIIIFLLEFKKVTISQKKNLQGVF